MRRPSARCTINTVTTRNVTSWANDAAAGRVPNFSGYSAPILCSVQPASQDDVAPHLREEQVNYYAVIFHDDPQLDNRDEILWGSHTLTVIGNNNASGRGRSFVIICQERQ